MLTLARGFLLLFDDLLLMGQGTAVVPVLTAAEVAGPQVNLAWTVAGITSETGYSIQSRDVTAAGSFAEIATVGADVAVYEGDLGPFTADHAYAYRVVVVGGPSDGQSSNVVTMWGSGGLLRRLHWFHRKGDGGPSSNRRRRRRR